MKPPHIALIGILFIIPLLFPQPATATVYDEGSLLKPLNQATVFLIEDGQKREINDETAFIEHGFRWDDIKTVAPHELEYYATGPQITINSTINIPPRSDALPDLVPFPMQDIHIGQVDGKNALRFSSIFWNQGSGSLQLRTNLNEDKGDGTYAAQQIIEQKNGSERQQDAGNITYHPTHEHHHLDKFSEYRLEPVVIDGQQTEKPGPRYKASFCLRDDELVDANLPNTPTTPVFTGCQNAQQGISVGWQDVYSYTLENQYLPIDGLSAGVYRLVFDVDPTHIFSEETRSNNTSVVLLYLDPTNQAVDILASTTPSKSEMNRFHNPMLITGKNSDKTYLVENNKKRWVKTPEILKSYGYSEDDIRTFPDGVVASIENESFVKTADGGVYMLNPEGYVRRILNPAVLSSYAPEEIPLINETEFKQYKTTQFVQKEGSPLIFSINDKTVVGAESQISQLDVNQLAVQTINETDFNAYAVSTVENNLEIPWGVEFLPNGDMLVTERPGTLNRYGNIEATIDIPDVLHSGEGGLMGVAAHPNFTENHYIYLYYTTLEDSSLNEVVRYRLDGDTLTEDRVIIDNIPGATYHDGGQIAFGPDGMLYITTGDAQQPNLAQTQNALAGKTLRLHDDGSIPSDNPFGTAVWSMGHRNPQGIAWDDAGNMWQTEHGRSGALSGFDELNLIERGANYGWPDIQGGVTRSGMRAPKLHSGPNDTWAPSGLAYNNDKLYFSGLRGSRLYVVTIEGTTPTNVEEFFTNTYGRLRAATMGPDGMLYVTTSNRDGRGSVAPGDDRVIKIAPEMLIK